MRQGRWLHADSCEGLIDRPNMYEQVSASIHLVLLLCQIHQVLMLHCLLFLGNVVGMGKEVKLRHWSNQ